MQHSKRMIVSKWKERETIVVEGENCRFAVAGRVLGNGSHGLFAFEPTAWRGVRFYRRKLAGKSAFRRTCVPRFLFFFFFSFFLFFFSLPPRGRALAPCREDDRLFAQRERYRERFQVEKRNREISGLYLPVVERRG